MDGFLVEPQNKGRARTTWKSSHEWELAGGYTKSAGFPVVHHNTTRLLGWAIEPRPKTWCGCQAKTGLTSSWNRPYRFGVAGHRGVSKRRTRVGITSLALRLSEVQSLGIRQMVLQRRSPKEPFRGMYPSLCNRGSFVFQLPPYKPSRERMAVISWKPRSFDFTICPSYFP
jgi:hypothetical protein